MVLFTVQLGSGTSLPTGPTYGARVRAVVWLGWIAGIGASMEPSLILSDELVTDNCLGGHLAARPT